MSYFVYKILGYFYDEISYDVTEFKIEVKIWHTFSKVGKTYKNYFLTCNHQLFHMYVGTKFKIHTNSTICMISLKPHAIILSAWIIYTIIQQVIFTAISRVWA